MEALKDKTLIMDSVAKIEKQETIAIPSTKQTVSAETQTIESVNELAREVKIPEGIVKVADEDDEEDEEAESEVVETPVVEEHKESTFEVQPRVPFQEKTLESTVPSLDAVERITNKILEMKMKQLDSTQMIDTSKVREAASESSKITPEFADMYRKTFGLDANEIRKEKELEKQEREKINVAGEFVNAENTSLFEKSNENRDRIKYRFVGIAFDNNIIIEYQNEMYIIDEMSARERINLEIIRNNYYSAKKDSTSLLLPDIVTCSFTEMAIARENIRLFRNAGFDYEEFGDNTIKLTAVPSMCEDLNTKILFINILRDIGNVAVNDIEAKEKKFISSVAEHSTVKPKLKLDEKEVDSLMQELLSLDEPFLSEQGKPTAIKMSRWDIEKKFARRK